MNDLVLLGISFNHRLEKPLNDRDGRFDLCSYCFGGSTAIRAGSTDLFQSIVICHPGPTSVGKVKAIKVAIVHSVRVMSSPSPIHPLS